MRSLRGLRSVEIGMGSVGGMRRVARGGVGGGRRGGEYRRVWGGDDVGRCAGISVTSSEVRRRGGNIG